MNLKEQLKPIIKLIYNNEDKTVRASALSALTRYSNDQERLEIIPFVLDIIVKHNSNHTRIRAIDSLLNLVENFHLPDDLERNIVANFEDIITNRGNDIIRIKTIETLAWGFKEIDNLDLVKKIIGKITETRVKGHLIFKMLDSIRKDNQREEAIHFLKNLFKTENDEEMKDWFMLTLTNFGDNNDAYEYMLEKRNNYELNDELLYFFEYIENSHRRDWVPTEKLNEIYEAMKREIRLTESDPLQQKLTDFEEIFQKIKEEREDLRYIYKRYLFKLKI